MRTEYRNQGSVESATGIVVTTLNEAECYGITREIAIEPDNRDGHKCIAHLMNHLLKAGVRGIVEKITTAQDDAEALRSTT